MPIAQAQQSRLCTLPKEVLDVLANTPIKNVPNSLKSSEVLAKLKLNNKNIDKVLDIIDAVPPIADDTVDRAVSAVQAADMLCNLLTVPKNIAVQSGITQVTATGFTGAILSRLDGARGATAVGDSAGSTAAYGADGMMGVGRMQKAPPWAPPGPAGPLTIYAMGNFLGGDSDAPNMARFAYDSTGGMVGIEYGVNRNLILGLAGGATKTDVALEGDATLDATALQGAVYLSYATRHLFMDALAAYGAASLDSTRPGVTGPIRGSTDAGAWALAARGGYLFDFGGVRAGPIVGLTYIRTKIDGYTETGDPQLAMTVGAQTIESLSGSAGLRFLAPFRAGDTLFIPYLNITLEHQFGDNTNVVFANLGQQAPVPLSLPVFGARDYGKVEGGVTIELAPQATFSLSGASTFAHDDGHDYRISAGLNYRF